MPQPEHTRIHAQTLAELNHSVGTGRRDAAYRCLKELAETLPAASDSAQRIQIAKKCLELVQEVQNITKRSSLMYSDPRQGIYDKPVLHFMRMLDQLLQSMTSLTEHVENVQKEAEVLEEQLGAETYQLLNSTCKDFRQHGVMVQAALQSTLAVGENLIATNSARRKATFTKDDFRRYDIGYNEYLHADASAADSQIAAKRRP